MAGPELRINQAAPSSALFRWERSRTTLVCLALVAIVVIVYAPIAHNGFLNYDDDTYITSNSHVKAGLTGQTIKWAFTTVDAANYHPLTWLSHAFDCQLFGVDPVAHHEMNVLLHALNAVLLFLLLQSATGLPWRSLFVAALFAIHPLNVESVAWAAERKNVLSMLFFLLALYAYDRYARKPNVGRYIAVAIFFALGLLSKPQVITFPVLLLLWDWWPLDRLVSTAGRHAIAEDSRFTSPAASIPDIVPQFSAARLVLEKLPLFALSVVSAIVTTRAQKAGGAVQSLTLYSPLLRVETAVISYTRYLGEMFSPTKLVALYPHPTDLYPIWQISLASLSLAIITAAVLRARSRRYLAVGWFWFLISLVPMIGLVQVGAQSIADRYTYIPQIGIFLMLTWLAADFIATQSTAFAKAAALAAVCLIILGALTYHQVAYWHDTPAFWTRTIALTRNNYVAHDELASYYQDHGQIEEATAHFREAVAIRPDDLPANLNLGTYEHSHGNLRAAIARYQMVALHAGDLHLRAAAYGNLGSAYRQLGDYSRARECFESALTLMPENTLAMVGLGLIAEKTGDVRESVTQYSRAMAIQPTDVGYMLLADALRKEGRSDEANAATVMAARLSSNVSEAETVAQTLRAGK